MLEGAYEKVRESKEQFKRDLDRGMTRARAEASAKRDELGSNGDTRRQPVAVPVRPAVDGPNERL